MAYKVLNFPSDVGYRSRKRCKPRKHWRSATSLFKSKMHDFFRQKNAVSHKQPLVESFYIFLDVATERF